MIKQLKICVAVLAGVLACGSLKAQQADSQDTAKPYEVYCEIVSTGGGFFTNKTTVEVDFGQFSSFFSNDRQLVDEQGNPIVFTMCSRPCRTGTREPGSTTGSWPRPSRTSPRLPKASGQPG